MSIATISPNDLHELVRSGQPVDLVDVRTPAEFRETHVSFARNVPLDRLDPTELDPAAGVDKPLYFICRTSGRGRKACEKLAAAGRSNVINVEGGTHAWDQLGLPVVRGKKTISLERQVRIAAGSLVFIGAVLGAFVSPYWIGLSAFVGAGLVFSGVTDTCGMAMVLARMPWNQVGACDANDRRSSPGNSQPPAPCCH
jgi:rhodanese-related sulfurtransferase